MPAANDETADTALARLNALRAEHKPIMDAIVSDAGMAPSTRALLVAHLLEEEDERLAEVSAALGTSQEPSPPPSPRAGRGGLVPSTSRASDSSHASSVGRGRVVPRRGDEGAPAGAGLTVGTMRRQTATSTAWRRDR